MLHHCDHRQVHRERHDIGGINQSVLAQAGAALGAAKNLLHFTQATSGVDQKACKAVAWIMYADIGPSPLLWAHSGPRQDTTSVGGGLQPWAWHKGKPQSASSHDLYEPIHSR